MNKINLAYLLWIIKRKEASLLCNFWDMDMLQCSSTTVPCTKVEARSHPLGGPHLIAWNRQASCTVFIIIIRFNVWISPLQGGCDGSWQLSRMSSKLCGPVERWCPVSSPSDLAARCSSRSFLVSPEKLDQQHAYQHTSWYSHHYAERAHTSPVSCCVD